MCSWHRPSTCVKLLPLTNYHYNCKHSVCQALSLDGSSLVETCEIQIYNTGLSDIRLKPRLYQITAGMWKSHTNWNTFKSKINGYECASSSSCSSWCYTVSLSNLLWFKITMHKSTWANYDILHTATT